MKGVVSVRYETVRVNPDDPTNLACVGVPIVTDTRDLEMAQYCALSRLADLYGQKYAAGFNYNGNIVQIDDESIRNINAQVTRAMGAAQGVLAWNADFKWIKTDNTYMPLPAPQDMIAFGAAAGSYVEGLIFTNRGHKDAVALLDSNEACDAYDVTTGWP